MNQVPLEKDQKFQVLLSQLQERYGAAHKMRERSTQFVLWISGMAIGIAWLLISHPGMTLMQRIALTLLISGLSIGGVIFLKGLQKGFQNNRRAMIACERSLSLYEEGAYMRECSLLPEAYAGTKRRWNDHFNTLTIWLIVVILALLILTWTCPSKVPVNDVKATQIQEQKEK